MSMTCRQAAGAPRKRQLHRLAFSGQQKSFRKICDHPIFRDETVAESTGRHVAPHDWTTSGREALEGALVGAPDPSLPGDPVLGFHQNLDVDLKILEGTVNLAEKPSDRAVPPSHVPVCEMGDIV